MRRSRSAAAPNRAVTVDAGSRSDAFDRGRPRGGGTAGSRAACHAGGRHRHLTTARVTVGEYASRAGRWGTRRHRGADDHARRSARPRRATGDRGDRRVGEGERADRPGRPSRDHPDPRRLARPGRSRPTAGGDRPCLRPGALRPDDERARNPAATASPATTTRPHRLAGRPRWSPPTSCRAASSGCPPTPGPGWRNCSRPRRHRRRRADRCRPRSRRQGDRHRQHRPAAGLPGRRSLGRPADRRGPDERAEPGTARRPERTDRRRRRPGLSRQLRADDQALLDEFLALLNDPHRFADLLAGRT